MTVSIETLVVGPLENNAYLLTDTTGHHVLVDAADEADRLLEWIGGRRIDTIVTTAVTGPCFTQFHAAGARFRPISATIAPVTTGGIAASIQRTPAK